MTGPFQNTPPKPEKLGAMTETFIKDALAGESQASQKYLAFADVADAEGYPNVARLFQAVAYAESTHARNHLSVLGGIGTTAENLAAAYLNTADAAAHFRLVDDKDNQTRLLWIRKNVPGLFSRTLKPAIDASFIRTGVAKTAAPPIQTAPEHGVSDPPPTEPELEELPL